MPVPLAGVMMFLISAGLTSDSWGAPPVRRIFASTSGLYFVHVDVSYKAHQVDSTTLTLCHLNDKGEEVRIWKRELDFVPVQLLVSGWGAVVSIDEWARLGHKHALVVFDEKGEVLADHELERLLSPEEIRDNQKVLTTVSSRMWFRDPAVSFRPENLLIRFRWDKELLVDLKSGKVIEP